MGLDVLVVNAGSTSLKLTVVDEAEQSRSVASFEDAADVGATGHRFAHGGPRLREPVLIDDDVEAELQRVVELSPLQNRPALEALGQAQATLPDVPHVAVFDTAFHATIPDEAATYALPERFRREIRRYGFHGLSVAWAAEQVVVPRLVVCHLGGGCSVTAVRHGRSVDTTMGFTPLEGVPMVTRSGSVDPGALLYLLRHGVSLDELDHALEHESGIFALAGTKDVREAAGLALDVFTYRVGQAVAAMAVALGGLDALVFTAGIGEHSETIRDRIVARLAFLGNFAVHVVEAREDVIVARATRAIAARR
jgi:acetate kinase